MPTGRKTSTDVPDVVPVNVVVAVEATVVVPARFIVSANEDDAVGFDVKLPFIVTAPSNVYSLAAVSFGLNINMPYAGEPDIVVFAFERYLVVDEALKEYVWNVGIAIADVEVVPLSQVVFVAPAVPPKHRVPEAPIVSVPVAPGPVTPVSKFNIPEVIVSDPLVANVGVAPEFIMVDEEAEFMIRL